MNEVSIIIPVDDRIDDITKYIIHADAAFKNDKTAYELIFVGDTPRSKIINEVSKYDDFPVRLFWFGRGDSEARQVEEALKWVDFENVAVVIAEAYYPVEVLPGMVRQLTRRRTDIVVANQTRGLQTLLRRTVGRIMLHAYGHVPLSLELDGDSGLKVFKKDVLRRLLADTNIKDLNFKFLEGAVEAGYIVTGYSPQPIRQRTIQSTVSLVGNSLKTTRSVVKRRLDPDYYIEFDDEYAKSVGSGFRYKGREYVTHNTLARKDSAIERTTLIQRSFLAILFLVLLLGALINGSGLLILIVSFVTILYFCDLLFNMFLIYRSLKLYSEISVGDKTTKQPREWPVYTILCPLYKEALVVPQFIAAMQAIDYPKRQLEVLLLLEEDDTETIDAIRAMDLPGFFKITIVPPSLPKTKPKACNYGLQRASGEYAVIYDAEDIPDPLQLKKAVIAFEGSGANIGCIQAKLNYYNWNQNILTRLFTLEYSLWFNLILTGLQSIKAPIPLGGTSNHFKTKMLRDLGGWDPFNVTEDADLGIRLAKRGLKTAVLDSTTLEEANSAIGNWLRQRSRWIKGYMQTYLVHMRDLREFGRKSRRIDMITFQLVIGGKVVSMLVNPLLWAMTIGYFLYRPVLGPVIESLYLVPVFYIGAVSLIIGNFLYLYYYMIGAARQGRPELIIFAVFVPFYWLMMSIAAVYALRDLMTRPFHWHKTKHGLHLKKASVRREAA